VTALCRDKAIVTIGRVTFAVGLGKTLTIAWASKLLYSRRRIADALHVPTSAACFPGYRCSCVPTIGRSALADFGKAEPGASVTHYPVLTRREMSRDNPYFSSKGG
jgi:hypothetical protein